jgi:hypothetical protein
MTSRGWDKEVLEKALDNFGKVSFDRLCSPPTHLRVVQKHKVVLTLVSCIWFSTLFHPPNIDLHILMHFADHKAQLRWQSCRRVQ